MSKRRTCGGKRRFRDQTEARRVMWRMAATSTRQVVPQRAYFCPRCKGWHLTSKPDRYAEVA